MSTDLVPVREQQVIDYVPSFAVTLDVAAERLLDFQRFIHDQMIDGEDFGTIPGTAKPTLYKPGAEKLANIFGFAARFEEIRTIEEWDQGMFYYSYKCFLENKRTGQIEAECVASCNSKEDKYLWRIADRKCPECGQDTIRKGAAKYGGGWYCNRKTGGCGAKFEDGDEAIESQEAGRKKNPDPFSLVNTFQKMAQKRALVGAVLIATRASGIFTQDLDDFEANGVPVKGDAPTKTKAKSGGKGKVSDDPMTRLWDYANSKGLKEGSVKDTLEKCEGDPEKALTELQQFSGEK